MTRERIRDLVRKRLGETTASFWSTTELNNWINDAGHDVAYRSKCIKKNGNVTTTEDDSEYTISSSFPNYVDVLEVYMYQDGATWKKISLTSRDRLDREIPGWKSANSSTPRKYYYSKEEDVLGLYPAPDSDNSGTSYLEVYYADDYTDMSGDSDTPTDIPMALQLAMIDYVVAVGYETRGYGDKSNDAMGKYMSRIEAYKVEKNREEDTDEDDCTVSYRS